MTPKQTDSSKQRWETLVEKEACKYTEPLEQATKREWSSNAENVYKGFKAGAKFVEANPTMIESVREILKQVDSLLITCNGISFYARAPKAFDGASEDLQEMITTMYDKQCDLELALKKLEKEKV